MNKEKLYTPTEVAERYRVAETTVRRWIRIGWISALDIGAGTRPGPYLFRDKDLEEFEARRLRQALPVAKVV